MSKKKIGTYMATRKMVDFDYLGKLGDKELSWLKQFRDEYYYDKFLKGKDHIHSKKHRKDLHTDNNTRRRDIWNVRDQVQGYETDCAQTEPPPVREEDNTNIIVDDFGMVTRLKEETE